MAELGRPTIYSDKIASEIVERMADGQSLRSICADAHMPARSTVIRWLTVNEDFSAQYAKAREEQAEALFEDLLDIADGKNGSEDVQRDRLRVDTRKWIASKIVPKKYGDKLTTEHTGEGGGPIITKIEIVGVKS